jgi:hypothetical protein
MKFFRKPPLNTIRKRFTWWPTHHVSFQGVLKPVVGASLIPFVPGFHNQNSLLPPPTPRKKNMRGQATGGGMVMAPVEWTTETPDNCWMWLEWVLEKHEQFHRDNGYGLPGTRWNPMVCPQQWNLWHEYD